MITQKPISFKIDKELLENLDTECKRTWRKRNACINKAISYYLEIMELRWLLRNEGQSENKKALLRRWLRDRIPEAGIW